MGSVYVVGSTNPDLVAYVDRLPGASETVGGGRFVESGGGKGANQAVAAARAGARCVFVSAVGDDAFGQQRLAGLRDAGVEVEHVAVRSGMPSGVAVICVDRHGENQIAVAPGANEHVVLDAGLSAAILESDVLLVQNEIRLADTMAAIHAGDATGATVIWNVAPAVNSIGPTERAALAVVDYLIVNRLELATLLDAHSSEPSEQVAELAARGQRELGARCLLVTLGDHGVLLATSDNVSRAPAHVVAATDTVGAGDCFAGVFAAALALQVATETAIRRAVAAAALCVTREGAQAAMPSADDVDRFLVGNRAG